MMNDRCYMKRCNIEGCLSLGVVTIPIHLKRGKRINHSMRAGTDTMLSVYICAEHLKTNTKTEP